ncbi:MAG TPA: ATP-binding protein [Miltoncostaea sp.]|nr:ATP-binding protein [Miltoncostaea sp.]
MSRTLTLTHPPTAVPAPLAEPPRARVATWSSPALPPVVDEFAEADAAALVEAVCDAVAERSAIPAPALREIVENLVHAGFRDAVVSVFDGGRTIRVSDHGPGIADRERALQPGYTTAGDDDRALILGVGGGLPFAAAALAELGGRLDIDDNLGGGTTVTLRLPADEGPSAPEPVCSGAAREILALLLEIGGAPPARLAEELGRSRAECGRELARLEHRGLVRREPAGARALTEAGTRLVATLF